MSEYGINQVAMERIFGFVSRSKNAVHGCTKYALLGIGRRLIDYSVIGDPSLWKHKPHPGYKPGLFVNNWQLGVDNIPSGMLTTSPDQSGSASWKSLSKIPRWPAYHDYFFANNVPYAARLEYGYHSTQVPPGGILAKIRAEYPQIIQEAIAQYRAEKPNVSDKYQISSVYGD